MEYPFPPRKQETQLIELAREFPNTYALLCVRLLGDLNDHNTDEAIEGLWDMIALCSDILREIGKEKECNPEMYGLKKLFDDNMKGIR